MTAVSHRANQESTVSPSTGLIFLMLMAATALCYVQVLHSKVFCAVLFICMIYHGITWHVLACGINQFQCGTTHNCISQCKVCDGDFDCADGSDEFNCSTYIIDTSSLDVFGIATFTTISLHSKYWRSIDPLEPMFLLSVLPMHRVCLQC